MHNEIPQLVRLEDEELLSRSHAIIRLESWHVLIEDLGSTNGTMLTPPGRETRRLLPGEPALLETGTVIGFGDVVTAKFYGIGQKG